MAIKGETANRLSFSEHFKASVIKADLQS